MWAQLINIRTKPGQDLTELIETLKSAEQPGSGLVRTLPMRDQSDPRRLYTLVVFENEAMAQAREQHPRRQEKLDAVRSLRRLRSSTVHRSSLTWR
jgi:hypothetical protein